MEEILASIRQIISEDGEEADAADGAGADTAAVSSDDAGPADGEETAPEANADDPSVMADEDQDADARAKADLAKAEKAFSSDDESPDDDTDEDAAGAASEAASSDDDAGAASEAASSDDDSGGAETQSIAFDGPAETAADDFSTKPDSNSDTEESTSMAVPAKKQHQAPALTGDDNLLSQDSDEVVHGAFSALAHTILAQNARTLEDLVTEMLSPMLKGWLDDNLPSLVERLVKEEIDRVSRNRR